ncbi:MAG: 1-deoxy-D-xylulose-5-phosphate reductoisomerase [Patescibacteria group bacterium]
MKNLIILGSTGSIGRQVLEVIRAYSQTYKVVGIAAKNKTTELTSQIKEFKPRMVVLEENGPKSLEKLVSFPWVNNVVVAIPGTVALEATLRAIKEKKIIFLATKEILVAAGPLIKKALKKYGAQLFPLDSEHSAILQCLRGEDKKTLKRIILTCSGGPFRNWKKADLNSIKKGQVFSHPVWKMGPKITVDSATLMNKGFEVLEAQYFFDLPLEKIEVLIHPEGIIHSMVEFNDGTIKALLSRPDMRFPIQYALFYPQRLQNPWKNLDLAEIKNLSFQKPDTKTFPCLNYAYLAGKIGGTMPAALNFADEVAVEMFLENKISFLDIPKIIEKILKTHQPIFNPSLKDILGVKDWVKKLSKRT